MLNRLPKSSTLLLIVLVVAIAWFWLSPKTVPVQVDELGPLPIQNKQQSLVSAIQPVTAANSADAVTPFTASQEFISRFEQANGYAAGGDISTAKLHYQDLISDYPQAVEPYVNLAALYAQDSQLGIAQQTLTDGINANQSYAALFGNLQKILGALAANAYKDALQEESGKITALTLPLLQAVHSGGASSQQLITLRQELQQSQKAQTDSAAEQKKVTELQSELSAAEHSLRALESDYQSKLATLQAKLDAQILTASNLAAAKQQAAIKQAELEQAERDRLAMLAAERDAKADQQALALAQQQAELSEVEKRKEAQTLQAENHVNRWAQAWSTQSVADYVASYVDGYVPVGRGLSHEQWREQRRVRLMNKSSIEIEVSDFVVSKTSQGFDVTFLQHYKAGRIDDRIRKRLSFAVPGDDWSVAKIIRETIIK